MRVQAVYYSQQPGRSSVKCLQTQTYTTYWKRTAEKAHYSDADTLHSAEAHTQTHIITRKHTQTTDHMECVYAAEVPGVVKWIWVTTLIVTPRRLAATKWDYHRKQRRRISTAVRWKRSIRNKTQNISILRWVEMVGVIIKWEKHTTNAFCFIKMLSTGP